MGALLANRCSARRRLACRVAGRGSGAGNSLLGRAMRCVDAIREYNVARIELMTNRADGVAPSCLDDAYRAIEPVAGRSDVRGGIFMVRCGTMRVKIVDVRAESDVATIRYREEPGVDRDMLDEVSACEPELPGAAPRDGEARALRVGAQWRLSQ